MNILPSFLGKDDYRAMLIRDNKDNAAAVEIENTTLKSSDSLAVEMPAGGGFIARFSRN